MKNCILMVACSFAIVAQTLVASSFESPQIPFQFVENRGQFDRNVRFVGTGPAFKVLFGEKNFRLQQGDADLNVSFAGAGDHPRLEGMTPLGATANYFVGADASQWRTDLQIFGAVYYRDIWPGVEISFLGERSDAKAEYVISPGATPAQIHLRFQGNAQILSDGSLMVSSRTGEFRESKPFIYQLRSGEKTEVAGGFLKYDDGTIGFEVPHYDSRKPLVIDPPILFSGYVGGSSQSKITAVAMDSSYNVVVAGWTLSTDLAVTSGIRRGNGVEAFVARFSAAGGSLLSCTCLGGAGDDRAFGVAVDSFNNIYVTGWTSSTNFPISLAIQPKLSGTRDAFVSKLAPSGNTLVYSTYLGGTGADSGNAITLDASGSVIVTGDTTSANLPVTPGVLQPRLAGGQDTFLAKLSSSGTTLSFLTYFGGSATDHATSVKTDPTGAIYFCGSTYSSDFPVANPAQATFGGGQDGFISKLSGDGKSIVYSSFIGGSGGGPGAPEQVNSIAVAQGYVYAAGVTSSPDFPISDIALQKTYGGGLTDGFMIRLNLNGSLLRSSYFGGSGDDCINGIALDPSGYFYLTGYTSSTDFPVFNARQSVLGGSYDAFLVKGKFTRLIFSTYLGGAGSDSAEALAIDSLTNITIAGSTTGAIPVVGNVGSSGGAMTSFMTKLGANFTCAVVSAPTFYFDLWHTTGYASGLSSSSFGAAGDTPVAGDWDGTGKKRIGVFRGGYWFLDMNGNGVFDSADKVISFGQIGDVPIVGDWDGTGRIKLGVYRQGSFLLDFSGHLSGVPTGVSDVSFPFGDPLDVPVAADWNKSGTTKVGVFRNGQWLVDYSGTHSVSAVYSYGQAGDTPVIGDWDSSGAQKIGVYRRGVWILDYDGDNTITSLGANELYFGFGAAGYAPLVF